MKGEGGLGALKVAVAVLTDGMGQGEK